MATTSDEGLTDMRAGGSAMGSSTPGSGISAGDAVSSRYRMTVDEACDIMNVKKDIIQGTDDAVLTELLESYERMMKANEKTSHYIQSKIVRAKERIEHELPQWVMPASRFII